MNVATIYKVRGRLCIALAVALGTVSPVHAQGFSSEAHSRALQVEDASLGFLWWRLSDDAAPGRSLFVNLDAARLYGLNELLQLRSGLRSQGLPLSWSVSAATFGYSDFRHNTLSLSTLVQPRWAASLPVGFGGRMTFHHLSPRGYAAVRALRLDGIWTAHPHPAVTVTASAPGLLRTRNGDFSGSDRAVTLGGILRLSGVTYLAGEYVKEEQYPGSVRAGLEVLAARDVSVRIGAATEPSRLSGGLGVRRGAAVFDVAMEIHHVLGTTSNLSLALRL